jgi:hypothetical protein
MRVVTLTVANRATRAINLGLVRSYISLSDGSTDLVYTESDRLHVQESVQQIMHLANLSSHAWNV